ncbi:MAG: A/G-specific adenine glycosylase [Patescibacteria group bacterium]|nr:A/G-specific adenine glycosylase [Patescibacteria group bacterium]MDE2437901.1 A/G-specific adenine glycosylase [Patescibacteria group bacterium]
MTSLSRIRQFRRTVRAYYRKHKRAFPWRETADPYHILVSEIMLQQTQVGRVCEKYPEFVAAFPEVASLAEAPLSSVLRVWKGMGYNRRALALKSIAYIVCQKYGGVIPRDPEILRTLPGIGKGTAGSIPAFAYNIPTVFIETNIRRVFIYHFFPHATQVRDETILKLVAETLDRKNPRAWYSALMDYGSYLGSTLRGNNPNIKSKHYRKQSAFEGSNRKIRGIIIALLSNGQKQSMHAVIRAAGNDSGRVRHNLSVLVKEGFLEKQRGGYRMKS